MSQPMYTLAMRMPCPHSVPEEITRKFPLKFSCNDKSITNTRAFPESGAKEEANSSHLLAGWEGRDPSTVGSHLTTRLPTEAEMG